MEELETQLSLTFELAEWSTQSFTIKKFLVEANEDIIDLYHHLLVVFSHEAFGTLPEKIEILTLLEGKKYTFSPTIDHIAQGIMHLELYEEPVAASRPLFQNKFKKRMYELSFYS